MEPALRPVQRPADDHLLEAVFACGRELEVAALPPDPALRSRFLAQQYAAHQADRAARWVAADHLVITSGGEAVGALLVDRSHDPWHLVDFAVLPSARGAGLGSAVLSALLADARGAGCALELSVVPWNPAARLYARFGFEAIGGDATATRMRREPRRQPNVIE